MSGEKRFKRAHLSARSTALILVPAAILVTLAVVLLTIVHKPGGASGRMELEELEGKALSEVREMIPEAAGLEYAEELVGQDFNRPTYNLKHEKGNNIGMISADRMSGEVLWLYDARRIWSSSTINVDMSAARSIALRFMKEQKGIDLETGDIEIFEAELISDGMEGPPDNPVETFHYSFTFKQSLNGLPVNGGAYGYVWISPEDGRVYSYSLNRGANINVGKRAGDVRIISDEEAVDIALKWACAQPDAPKGKPHIPD